MAVQGLKALSLISRETAAAEETEVLVEWGKRERREKGERRKVERKCCLCVRVWGVGGGEERRGEECDGGLGRNNRWEEQRSGGDDGTS